MDITNVSRETLVKQYEEAKSKFIAAKESLKSDFAETMNLWFVERGIDSFCTFDAHDDGYGYLNVSDGGERHEISVHYYKRWKDNGGARYELTMNYSGFGSFSEDESAKVKYAQVIGFLATDLTSLQNRLSRLNWVHVRELQKIYFSAEGALANYNAYVVNEERERKRAEILPYVKTGGKFNIGKGWNNEDVIATIVDVKRKYVDFDFVSKRLTREQIVDNVIYGKWTVCK